MSTIKTTSITHGSNSGTANMVLASNGGVTFPTPPGLFSSYAIICDEKSAGTLGGASVANTWTTRDLNTEIADPDSIVSISSNQFTLGAGNYLIKWHSPFFYTQRVVTRLYDVTNSAVKQYSQAGYIPGSSGDVVQVSGYARVTPTGSTAYKIEYYADNGGDNDGTGIDTPDDNSVCIYTVVEIYKEA